MEKMEKVLFTGGDSHGTAFGTNGLCFIVEFVVFKCPFRPIEANCRIYVVFIDEEVFYVAKQSRKTTLPFRV